MLTDDAFRRRELADLGIRAEVQSDGHTIVATFDLPQFDNLVACIGTGDYDDGFSDGVDEAVAAAESVNPPVTRARRAS